MGNNKLPKISSCPWVGGKGKLGPKTFEFFKKLHQRIPFKEFFHGKHPGPYFDEFEEIPPVPLYEVRKIIFEEFCEESKEVEDIIKYPKSEAFTEKVILAKIKGFNELYFYYRPDDGYFGFEGSRRE